MATQCHSAYIALLLFLFLDLEYMYSVYVCVLDSLRNILKVKLSLSVQCACIYVQLLRNGSNVCMSKVVQSLCEVVHDFFTFDNMLLYRKRTCVNLRQVYAEQCQ